MTTPREEPPLDPAVARLLDRRAPAVVAEPPLWREPLRALVLASSVLIAVTANLPWLHQEGIGQTIVLTGRSGLGDGVFLAVVAGVTAVIVVNREVARSRAWFFRWLPAVLGVVGGAFVLSAIRAMENQIAIWRDFGATGVYEPGFFVFVAAGITFAVPASWIGLRRGLATSTDGAPNERLVIQRRGLLVPLVTVAGLIAGALAGGWFALRLDVPATAVGIPLLALSVTGGVIGGVAAQRIARSLLTGR